MRLVKTSRPLPSSPAATFALPYKFALMVLIRSPTVSAPVDLYVVSLLPSLTVRVPFARIPSVKSEVLVLTGAVPVPLAGALAGAGVLELVEDEPVELLDDDEPPVSDCSAL